MQHKIMHGKDNFFNKKNRAVVQLKNELERYRRGSRTHGRNSS